MGDNDTQNGVDEKNFEKIGLFFGVQGQVEKCVDDDISAPTTDLAKPIFW